MRVFSVEFAPAAVRALKRLEPKIRLQLLRASTSLQEAPHPVSNPKVKILVGMEPRTYRLRMGDYRIIYRIEGSKVIIVEVAHRREVYR